MPQGTAIPIAPVRSVCMLLRIPVLALLLSYPVQSQTAGPSGSIHGYLKDSTNAPVAAAKVLVRNSDTNFTRETKSDAEGRFVFAGLPVGNYVVHAEQSGFTSVDSASFEVRVGQILEVNLMLAPEGVSSRIDVTEQADSIEAAATTTSAALGGERIEEAPARSRNYLNFTAMAPGLASTSSAGAQRSMTVLRSPVADSGFSFGGLRGRNNSVEVDGVDNRDETTGGNRVAIGLEMVQEFRVAAAMTGAELGGAAGGLINVVTRTGVNQMHGDVTFFGQVGGLNASRSETSGGVRPDFHRYQPGASWYGPLRRDQTFLAAAFEAERESGEEWSDTPEESIDRINRVLSSASWRNLPVRSVLRGLYPTSERGEEFFTKLNHQVGSADSLAARYAFSRGRAFGDVQPMGHFLDRSAGGSSRTTDHSATFNWFHVATPNLVWETRAQYGRREQDMTPNSSGPMVEIPGSVTFGQAYRMDSSRAETHWQAVEAADWVHARHRISFGAQFHSVHLDARLADHLAGIFLFPTLEAFERNQPDIYSQSFGNPNTQMDTRQASAWIQERWQATRPLFLEAGVRADRQWFSQSLPGSGWLLSPRAGLAWRPSPKRPLVFRAGFGLFYDRYPLVWLNQALWKDGRQGFETYQAGAAATAALLFLQQTGTAAVPAFGGQSTYVPDRNLAPAASRKITLGGEYGLNSLTTLTGQMSWVRGWHLPRTRNIAAGLPPTYLLESTAQSSFRGASISVNRRMFDELTFLINYDMGRTFDDGSDFDEQLQNPLDARADWAHSRLHQRHRLSANALWEIPLPPAAPHSLQNWTIAPVAVLGSGRPINALYSTDSARTGAFPIAARPSGVSRNPHLGQATIQFDARLMKTIRYREGRCWLQFGAEAFNLLNHTNPVTYSEYSASPAGPLSSYARMSESAAARQVQLFIQFEY